MKMGNARVCKTWKCYHSKMNKAYTRVYSIAGSLSSSKPYGVNPTTRKQYSSAKAFAKALHKAEKEFNKYAKLTKAAYKRQTGLKW